MSSIAQRCECNQLFLTLGTDSGLKFKATNIESKPTQAIYQIKPNVPNHPAASFYNLKQKSVPPMAEFKINLVHAKGRCSRNTDPKAGTPEGNTLVRTIKFSPSTAGSNFRRFTDEESDALHFTY